MFFCCYFWQALNLCLRALKLIRSQIASLTQESCKNVVYRSRAELCEKALTFLGNSRYRVIKSKEAPENSIRLKGCFV